MITVIIPAYNRPQELQKALFSLCAQTKQDFKVIVSDDASTEDIKSVCDQFEEELDLTYLRSDQNGGCAVSRQIGLSYVMKQAPTDYVMFLDSDDALMPYAIERMEEVIEHNQADLILTNILQQVGGDKKHMIDAANSRTWMHGKIYRLQFLVDHQITFPLHLRTNEDLAFNLSLYAYDPESYLLDEEVYYFSDHPASVTKQPARRLTCFSCDYIEAMYWIYKHYRKVNKLLPNQMIANIINCYNYYQRGVIYGTIKDKTKEHMKQMLHYEQVSSVLVQIYAHKDATFNFDQWTIKDDSLVFFGQTFGSWLMTFFTTEEIKKLIRESGLQK